MNKIFTFLLMLIGLMISPSLNAQTITGDGTFTFSTAGSYELIIPAGCTADIAYEMWGGGGAGGAINLGNANSRLRAGTGGGGGAYSMGTTTAGGGSYTIVVGAGGIVSNFATTKKNGANSTGFSVTARGGRGGANSSGGAGGVASTTGTVDVAGGVGGNKTGNATSGLGGAGGGGSGATAGAGNDNTGATGGIGGTPNGANGGNDGLNGINGIAPGGGGGGKGSGGASYDELDPPTSPADGVLISGDGADGQVIIIVSNYFCAPLPVELIDFKATANNKQVDLEWQTASELNNEGFEIQKSTDGTKWTMLEFTQGRGNSDELNTYTHIDKAPTSGVNYYRLKQMDFDGRETFSDVVTVKFNNTRVDLNLYPTFVQSEVNLDLTNFADENVAVDILDGTGRVVFNISVNSSEVLTLNLGNLNLGEGMYFVRCQSANQTTTGKFLFVK